MWLLSCYCCSVYVLCVSYAYAVRSAQKNRKSYCVNIHRCDFHRKLCRNWSKTLWMDEHEEKTKNTHTIVYHTGGMVFRQRLTFHYSCFGFKIWLNEFQYEWTEILNDFVDEMGNRKMQWMPCLAIKAKFVQNIYIYLTNFVIIQMYDGCIHVLC